MTRSQDNPLRAIDEGEPDYDMFFLLKNLREKKAKGTLSELDKKLLVKIQRIVEANPKDYHNKIAYLQLVYNRKE